MDRKSHLFDEVEAARVGHHPRGWGGRLVAPALGALGPFRPRARRNHRIIFASFSTLAFLVLLAVYLLLLVFVVALKLTLIVLVIILIERAKPREGTAVAPAPFLLVLVIVVGGQQRILLVRVGLDLINKRIR